MATLIAPRPREVAPDDVAAMRAALSPLVDHPLLLSRHEIEQRVTPHVRQAVRLQQRFDLLTRSPAEKRKLIAHRRVFVAEPGASRERRLLHVELAVHDHETAS